MSDGDVQQVKFPYPMPDMIAAGVQELTEEAYGQSLDEVLIDVYTAITSVTLPIGENTNFSASSIKLQ